MLIEDGSPFERVRARIKQALRELGEYRYHYLGAIQKALEPYSPKINLSVVCRGMVANNELLYEERLFRGQRLPFYKLPYQLDNSEKLFLDLLKEIGGEFRYIRISEIVQAASSKGMAISGHKLSRLFRPLILEGFLEARTVKNGTAVMRSFRLVSGKFDDLLVLAITELGRENPVRSLTVFQYLHRRGINLNTQQVGMTLSRLARMGKINRSPRGKFPTFYPAGTTPKPKEDIIFEELARLTGKKPGFGADEIAVSLEKRLGIRLSAKMVGYVAHRMAKRGWNIEIIKGPNRTKYYSITSVSGLAGGL